MSIKNEVRTHIAVEVSNPGTATGAAYGIVLAAGNGNRIREFIYRYYGVTHPKQYVAFTGKQSMIQHTIRRVEKLIPREKIVVVVDPNHMLEIEEQLRDRPPDTLVFQPLNRETAPGILLPLSRIFKTNPESTVAIFPSDQFIQEEDRFMEHVRMAQRVIEKFPDKVVLLGIEPDTPEVEYGWIQPGASILSLNGIDVRRVERFHEKPDPISAQEFLKKGFLWNTLVMVTRCRTIWRMAAESLPAIQHQFETILKVLGTLLEEKVVLEEYQKMGHATISRSILEKHPDRLLVIPVRGVSWSDWGDGPRVLETLKKIGRLPNFMKEFSPEGEKLAVT